MIALSLLAAGCDPADAASTPGGEAPTLRITPTDAATPQQGAVAMPLGLLDDGSMQGRYVARMATRSDGTTRKSHHLVFDDGEIELTLPPTLAPRTSAVADVPWPRDTLLRASGAFGDDGRFDVDDITVVLPAPQPLIDAEPFAPREVGLVLLKWGDNAGLMNGYGKEALFTGDEAVSVFYGEASYGRERFIGEVFGPYEIDDPGFCDPYGIGASARQAMIDKGHDPTKYSQLMYHFPQAGCDFAGLADIGAPQFPARDSWYQASLDCVVRVQELGHNYGMGHSHAYDCGVDEMGNEIVFADNCTHIEYGDPYDPMGGGCAHINAVQKLYMGWLDGCNLVEATADGDFNLSPLELPCDGTQVLRVPAFDGRFYYLEYRQPIGQFDADVGLDGVVVHVADELGNFGPSPYYLDINGNGLMHEGDSFTDPMGAVSFTVSSADATHAVVSVTFPDGGSGAPTCKDGAAPEMADGAVGALSCARAPYPADDAAPTVTITYPADGDVFEPGSDFTITADAMDDRLLSDVVLYLNGEPLIRLFEPPWQWDVTNIPSGPYEFGVIASDGRNEGYSQAVTIQVGGPPAADSSGSGGDGTTGVDPTDGSTGDGGSSSDGGGAGALDDDGGCSCRADPRGRAWLWLPGLALVALGRRRRTQRVAAR
ncbi:MAG: hypothetical protein K1X88_17650 [Nannocystaceae bacterium]|nr:hypothetical protein [Nannocystaceae bacterium]